MKRILSLLLISIVVVFLGVLATVFWLLNTEAGASWVWAKAVDSMPDRLSAESFNGSLKHGVTVRDVRYADEAISTEAALLQFSVGIDWFGSTVNINSLRAKDVVVQQGPPNDTAEPSAPLDETLSSLQLPVTIGIRDLLIDGAEVRAADGSVSFALDTLAVDAVWGENLTIERVDYSAGAQKLAASGSVELSSPHALDLSANFVAGDALTGSGMPRELRANLSGDLRRLNIIVDSAAPDATIRGVATDLADQAQFDLLLEAEHYSLASEAADPSLSFNDLRLKISGELDAYRAELETELASSAASPIASTAEFTGNLQSISVARLTLESDELLASLSGDVNWDGAVTASAAMDVQRLDPARWLTEWPDAQFLSGQARLMFSDARLEIAGLQLAHNASSASLNANGVVDTQEGVVDIRLNWQDLQWPLSPAPAAIESRRAELTITGTPDNWALQGDVALAAADLPPGNFVLDGGGSTQEFSLSIKDSSVLGGRVVGDVAVDLRDAGSWTANLDTSNISITPFLPNWPGQVSAAFNADGMFEPFSLDITVSSLDGQVRGRAISAAGRLQMTSGQLRFDEFVARSGSTNISLDGDWQDADGVSFRFQSPSLSDVLPGAAGSVVADGRLLAGTELPLLYIDIEAAGLDWRDWTVGTLALKNAPGGDALPFAMNLDANDILVADQAITSAELSLEGNLAAHKLRATITQMDRNLGIALSGALSNWEQPDKTEWTGAVESMKFAGREELALTLRERAQVSAGPGGGSLSTACIDVSQGGAVCGSGSYDADGQYRADLELQELPLNLLRNVTSTGLQFTQLLTGTVQLATGPAGRPSGGGRIDMTAGQIRSDYDEELTLPTRAGFASFRLDNGQLLAGELSLPFSDAAEVAGTFRVVDVSRGQSSPVTGQLTAVVRDLGVGARIMPQIDEAAGSLDADFRVAGTLEAPQFSGGFVLRDGHVVYDPLGLDISDIQLESRILPGNRVEVDSTFKAGDGVGTLRSSADYLQGRRGGFAVAVTGQNLRLVDLPDLQVVVDPDLELGVRGDDVSINGRLMVPSARLASIRFVNSGVSESDDVVYVGDEQPEGEPVEQESSPLNYSGSVILELGDDVAVDLDIAEAQLSGSSTYTWDGPALPRATGLFTVGGKFEAYGQLLEITEGTIRYAGVPANNPQLRIRAEREIYGNSQVRSAGVFVSGTALKPKLEVYTSPATTPDRAVTLLVTGSDFSYEQGVGAVDVGTYIAPRLYASYGIGLFDKENVISVRYDLAKGFGIKATSGKRAAGIDISYTIER